MQRFSLILLLLFLSTEAFSKVFTMKCGTDSVPIYYKFDNRKKELYTRHNGQWQEIRGGCEAFSIDGNSHHIFEQETVITKDSFFATCTARAKPFEPFIDTCTEEEYNPYGREKCMLDPSGGTFVYDGEVLPREVTKTEEKPKTFWDNRKEYIETKETKRFLVDFFTKQTDWTRLPCRMR